jgi:Flp pilus assembly protein TadD
LNRPGALCAALALALAPHVARAAPDDGQDRLIDAAIRSGRLIQARMMLTRIPDPASGPRPVAIEALRAELALAEGRDDDALQAFDVLGAGAPENCRFLIGSGIAASRLGKAGQAVTSLRHATQGCTVDWRAWNALGVALDAQQQWEASASAYAHALALRPGSATLLNNIGMSLTLQHRFSLAADYFETALRHAPGDVRIVNNLDIARGSIGQPPVRNPVSDDAARWAERLSNAGRAAMLAGRSSEASVMLAQAVTTSPTYQQDAASSLARLQSR